MLSRGFRALASSGGFGALLAVVLAIGLAPAAPASAGTSIAGSALATDDTTPPVITPVVSGTLGLNGWYTSFEVLIGFQVSEPESPETLWTQGCGVVVVRDDTGEAGFTTGCVAHSAGGTSNASVTVKHDATPPTISCQWPFPVFALGQSPATVAASVSDPNQSSGVAPGSLVPASPQPAVTSSAGTKSVSYTAADNAGNVRGPVDCAYSVAKANQTISFGALPNKPSDARDFTVSATATSGLPVSFSVVGRCTLNAATVHLVPAAARPWPRPARCTVIASQAGDSNYNSAPEITHTFSITPAVKCVVPEAVGKTLAAARLALEQRHCRTGKVSQTYSKKTGKGRVASQSRRPGTVLARNTKVSVVVSRGPKH